MRLPTLPTAVQPTPRVTDPEAGPQGSLSDIQARTP
jgi:hypothetical protein